MKVTAAKGSQGTSAVIELKPGRKRRVTRVAGGRALQSGVEFRSLPMDEVWALYRATGDDGIRNFLVEKYCHVVRSIAERIRARLPAAVDVEDLVSSGSMGLMDAVSHFDPEKGVKFETFCGKRVQGAIFDNIRNMDDASRLARRRESQVAGIREAFRKEHGRNPNEAEIQERLDAPPEEIQRIIRDSTIPTQTSFTADNGRGSTGEGAADLVRELGGRSALKAAEYEDLRELILKGLTRAERMVILLYYYEGLTMKEIGIALGRSESRVSQMHSLIIARLRSRLHRREEEFELAGRA